MLSSITVPADELAPLLSALEPDVPLAPDELAPDVAGVEPAVPAALPEVPAVLPGAVVVVSDVPAAPEVVSDALRSQAANAALNKALIRTTFEVPAIAFM